MKKRASPVIDERTLSSRKPVLKTAGNGGPPNIWKIAWAATMQRINQSTIKNVFSFLIFFPLYGQSM